MQRNISVFFAVVLFVIFFPVLVNGKTLFPSNLLVSTYAPWKYEPVPEYPNGPPNKPIGFDNARQFYPDRQLLRESLLKGIVPFWNPYIYSGTPFMGAFDTAVWYPMSWIASLLPTVSGWNFLVIIQPVLSLLFMYLFLKSLKFETRIAAFGAFVWAFSGFMVVYWQEILVLEHSFLWLPLAMYGATRLKANQKDRIGFWLLVLALTSSVFGGFLQMSIYVYIMVLLWGMNRRIGTAVILSLLIASIQLIPSAEAYLLSPRGVADGLRTFQNALLPFQHLMTLIAPDFWGNPATYNYFGGPGFYFEKMIFIGIIPLIMAMYAIAEFKKKHIHFWVYLAFAALSLGLALPTSWLPYVLRIPVLSNSYPTRIFGVWAFAATVLSCYGVSSFISQPRYKRLGVILGMITAVLISGWTVALTAGIFGLKSASWYTTVSVRNLILPTLFIFAGWSVILIRNFSRTIAFAFVCTVTVLSGLYFAHKYVYFSEQRFIYPELAVTRNISAIAGINRVWGYGNAFLEKDIPQYFRWFSTDGYGNLSPNRYAQLLSTIVNNGKLGSSIRRSDTDIFEISEWDSMNTNPYRLRIMSILGVRYVLESKKGELKDKRTTGERFPQPLFALAWQDDSWRLWQYTQALPRVIFADKYIVKTRPQDIIDALYNPQVNPADTVILEENPGTQLSAATGSATIMSYELNRVTIRTQSAGDGFVLFTDNYYPGWRASVDGVNTKIYRADYSFKSVFVPKGRHTVLFSYAPTGFTAGAVISVLGLAGVLIL
jgi:hypothetical protein